MLLLLAAPAAAALDTSRAITQYIRDVWGTDAGLPHNSVDAIAQTRDGYLWVGTEEGLARFDGMRFTVFDKENTPALQSNHISALLVDSQDALWIGTQGGGLVRLQGGRFFTYTTQDGLPNDSILSLYQDEGKVLWIGTDGGGVSRFLAGKFETYTSRNGLPNDSVFSLAGDRHGNLWIGTHTGLARLSNGKIRTYTTKDGLSDNYIKCLYPGAGGGIWIGTNEGGLSYLMDGHFTNYGIRSGLSSSTIWSVFEDSAGTLWVGTFDSGLNRLRDGKFTSFAAKDGLPANRVFAVFEDREDNLWIGTGGGLVRLKSGSFTAITSSEGLSSDVVLPVYEDREGAIWVGTNGGGLNRIKDGQITTYTTRNGLSDNFIFSIAEDKQGNLWIATHKGLDRLRNGNVRVFNSRDGLPGTIALCLYRDRQDVLWAGGRLGLSRFDGTRFTTYTTKDGLSSDYVTSLYQDNEDTLWIGTAGGGLNRLRDGHFSHLTTKDGLSSNTIWSLTGDTEGTLWIGTSGGGLDRFKDSKFTAYTTRQGLFDDELFKIFADRPDSLWMSSNKGVFRVPRWQLKAYAEGHLASITSIPYGISDGLKDKECNGGFQPAGWQTRDGRLLFPTMKGLAIVDPARMTTNRLPPPVLIERAQIDGLGFDPRKLIRAKPGKGQLEFEFTAPSLVSSDKIRFKYKLEGFDKDWIDAGERRAAFYTNIPPGEYRFTVIACNNDGVWNKTGSSILLTLAPHIYQTRLFVVSCIALIIGLCFGIYRLRINHLKANERQLLLLVEERTQALQEQVNAKERALAELAEAQQHLMELSRRSGMAEIATGVLHNVGNVLNSVNVAASVIATKLRESRIDNLSAAVDLMQAHAHELSRFLAADPKGQRVMPYLVKLTAHLRSERHQVLNELETLTMHIDHIKKIVATQQDYAKVSALVETVCIPDLIEDALRMVEASLDRHQVEVTQEIEYVPDITAAKHLLLEILVNLLRNAKQAVVEHNGPQRQIRICVRRRGEDQIRIEVHDTGTGLPPENLTRIFAHGFTTKLNGHGFGLHSGALAARQMHGSLWAESKGPGCGATFILELPVNTAAPVAEVTTI
jgi:ligand-binding sensor domain-containing protein/signal transduction histidine kinase